MTKDKKIVPGHRGYAGDRYRIGWDKKDGGPGTEAQDRMGQKSRGQ